MRNLYVLLLLSFTFSSYAQLDTITLTSKIKEVTVFFSGAEVNREGKINLPKGKHVVLLDKLPQGIYPQSIQVKSIKDVTILSVKQESAFFNTSENKTIKTIEKEIEAKRVSIKRIKNKIKVLDIEETFLLENSKLAGKEKSVTIEELKIAAAFYNERLTTIRYEIIDLEIETERIKDEITGLYQNMNQVIQQNKQAYSKVFITLECNTSISNNLKASYFTPTAGWVPTYDFRVKEISDPLKIVYNANVFQSSGENWNKVNITLSSNNPSLSGYKPELQKWILGQRNTYIDRNSPIPPTLQIPNYGGVSSIKGQVLNTENNEPIPFANVILLKNGEQVLGTTTDFDGNYTLKPIDPSTYSLQVSYIGYQTIKITGIRVNSDQITVQNVNMNGGIKLDNIEVIGFNKPLFEKDQTTVGTSVTREEVERMAVRSVADIAKASGNGVYSRDDGYSSLNARGQRDGSSITFIDGVKVKGTTNLPRSSIEEVSVNLGRNPKPMFEDIYRQYDKTNLEKKSRYVSPKLESTNLIQNNVSDKILNLEYNIKIPYTIPSDGKDYNLKIKETNVPVEYEYFVIPKLDKDAFLTAHLNNWEELDLLSGKASIYFKGTFTGESFINADQSEDTLTLSLGRDKNIIATREENKKVDEKQFYGSNAKETIAWDIVVKNNKSVPVKITVEDQYPTSNRKAVEVELISAEGAEKEKKSGKLSWSFNLLPQAKKELLFKYEVKYPKYMDLRTR